MPATMVRAPSTGPAKTGTWHVDCSGGRVRCCHKDALDARNAKLDALKAKLDAGNAKLDALKAELNARNAELDDLKAELKRPRYFILFALIIASGGSPLHAI
jgi:hypothetical protein